MTAIQKQTVRKKSLWVWKCPLAQLRVIQNVNVIAQIVFELKINN